MRRLLSQEFVSTFGRLGRRAGAILVLLFASLSSSEGQVDVGRDLIGENLFPPDLILRQAEAIGLTDAQREAVQTLVKETKRAMGEKHTQLKEATAKLRDSLGASNASEATATESFAALLALETELKRAQFGMLLKAKSQLTPEQQEKLRVIFRSLPKKSDKHPERGSTDARQELNARMQKVQAGVEKWRSEGRDPAPIVELINTFGEQMQAGKLPDAKDTLNRAIERLNEPKPR